VARAGLPGRRVTVLGVFLAVLVADALWTLYVRATAERRPVAAAWYSAAIVLAGGVTTLAVVASPWYLLPASAGAFVGTWWAAR
jgi:hypothetical protein